MSCRVPFSSDLKRLMTHGQPVFMSRRQGLSLLIPESKRAQECGDMFSTKAVHLERGVVCHDASSFSSAHWTQPGSDAFTSNSSQILNIRIILNRLKPHPTLFIKNVYSVVSKTLKLTINTTCKVFSKTTFPMKRRRSSAHTRQQILTRSISVCLFVLLLLLFSDCSIF